MIICSKCDASVSKPGLCERCRMDDAADALLAALKEVTEMYCDMVNSGDCGFWDPESVDEIKHARAAIAKAIGT